MKHIIKILYIINMISISVPSLFMALFWSLIYWDWLPVNSCMDYMVKTIDDVSNL